MADETPQLRASDADRERAADRLRYAAGEGRLTVEELDERLEAAYAASTQAELEPLVADLPVPPAPPAGRPPVRPGEGGVDKVIAIMSGRDRTGRWRVAPRCTVVNVMGGADLDFNDAELAAERVEVTVVAIMGGSDIHVPAGLNVEVSDFSLMGGNDVDLGRTHPDPGGPVLAIKLISIMGGTNVVRGRRKSLRDRWHERGHRGMLR